MDNVKYLKKTFSNQSAGDISSAHSADILSIKELRSAYGIPPSTVYNLIRTDPSFPYYNIGTKKKFVVSRRELEVWLADRRSKEKAFSLGIKQGSDLIERFTKDDKQS